MTACGCSDSYSKLSVPLHVVEQTATVNCLCLPIVEQTATVKSVRVF